MSHGDSHHHEFKFGEKLTVSFYLGILLNSLFILFEFFCGYCYNSIGLISDAGHNLGDIATLIFSLIAFRFSFRPSFQNYSYGLKKSTVLISLLNAIILYLTVIWIAIESIEKIINPSEVSGLAMVWVALCGILVNGGTALLFSKGKEHDLNIKSVYLHMLADTIVSFGVVISGVLIHFTSFYLLDPIIGLVVALIIAFSTKKLFSESIRLVLDGIPYNINVNRIKNNIESQLGVYEVHHIHVWAMSTTEFAFTAHIVVRDFNMIADLKREIRQILKDYKIEHSTLEFESVDEVCSKCCSKTLV